MVGVIFYYTEEVNSILKVDIQFQLSKQFGNLVLVLQTCKKGLSRTFGLREDQQEGRKLENIIKI